VTPLLRRCLRALAALLALPLLIGATAPSPLLVPDVSQREIEIRFSFTGAELLLFGAILYPGGRLPSEPADIVVVLKGPSQPITMREKQKIAGIWVNADSIEFRSAPSFYAIASSKPLKALVDERTAAIYELGLDNLQLSPSSLNESAEIARFAKGLNDLKGRNGLYVDAQGSVEITDGVLYRARLPLSARVITGTYTAETFLIQKGRVVAAAVREIEVKKSGFERLVGQFSQEHGIIYGLIAIVMALAMGWAAGAVANRI